MTTSLVTGANRGIGQEVAIQLAALGHHVLLGTRTTAKAAPTRERIESTGGSATIVRLDLTDPSTIDDARRAVEAAGGLDVLVNNAGTTYDSWQTAIDADLGVARKAMETNLFGTWELTMALVPMIRQSAHGRIVNVSSGAGALTDTRAHRPGYRISKLGLNALTIMWATELPGTLVNAVCPGVVATDMGGPGGRPVSEGARGIVWAATLADDGPTGGFFRDRQPIPW